MMFGADFREMDPCFRLAYIATGVTVTGNRQCEMAQKHTDI